MDKERYVVMGAGEVGFHLARALSREGHDVVLIEVDAERRERLEDKLDAAMVAGNGAHAKTLGAAGVERCDLFMAVSSSDEANLAAAVLAKKLGAQRTVVRMSAADEVTSYGRLYRDVFGADLMLSTQLLATTRILNHILGHNTVAVQVLARGKVQLRKIHIEEGSLLAREKLRHVSLPAGSLVVAFFRGEELIIPSGDDQAQPDDDALILCKNEVIDRVERLLSSRPRERGKIVLAGGGATALAVADALASQHARVTLIEKDRPRAQELAVRLPKVEVVHGDATDMSLLRAERAAEARAFVALTGDDERTLMASLLAQELGVPRIISLVQRSETSQIWRQLGTLEIVSPRTIAHQRIQEYIRGGYSANIVSLQRGKAQVLERRLAPASPAAGVTLAEMSPPRGLIVGAVVRGEKVFVPQGKDRLEVGDSVILFVHQDEVPMVRLLFPGEDPE